MGKGKHYPRVLPTGGLEHPREIQAGDRVQKPRSPIFVVSTVAHFWYSGFTRLYGRFEESGHRGVIQIDHGDDISDWGWER